MSTYSYSRTSDVEELECANDIEVVLEQESLSLQSYALERDIQINNKFMDKAQPWTRDFQARQAGRSLLDTLSNGDTLLVNSLERVFSSCEDLRRTLKLFKESKIKLVVLELDGDITEPELAPSFDTMLSIFQKLEKRRSTERIKVVKQNQRNKGRFLGGSRPFGYMIHSNGRLIENPMEQRILKKIIRMKQQGKSLRAISSAVSTPLTPVSFKTVQRLLKRHASNATTARSLSL